MTVLDQEKSDALRRQYINAFVNTESLHYKEYVEQKKTFSDGMCYTGYLWDCFLHPRVVSKKQLELQLKEKRNIYIMWDIHSCERIFIPDYWKFPKESVLFSETWQDAYKDILPEDIYIFDDTFSWSAVYTHEIDLQNEDYCLYLTV